MKLPRTLARRAAPECFYLFAVTYFLSDADFRLYPLSAVGILISRNTGSAKIKYLVSMVLGFYSGSALLWILYGAVLHTTVESLCFFETIRSVGLVAKIQMCAIVLAHFARPAPASRALVAAAGIVLLWKVDVPLVETRKPLETIYRRVCGLLGNEDYRILCREYKAAIRHLYRRRPLALVDFNVFLVFLPLPRVARALCAILGLLPLPRHAGIFPVLAAAAVLGSPLVCVVVSPFLLPYAQAENEAQAVLMMLMFYLLVATAL